MTASAAPPISKERHRIQRMFGTIAPTYDFFNHAFSLNIDQMWRRFTVKQALRPTDRRVLDLACGTGDLTLALRKAAHRDCEVIGADFCPPMLRIAHKKGRGLGEPPFVAGDGLRLPFGGETFDLVTIAFGLRNMEDTEAGLTEMHRVLRPGGRLAVLEFTLPANPLFRLGYLSYFRTVLPAIGRVATKSDAYRYLSESVMEWPNKRELAAMMRRCGFARVRHAELSFGIAVLHIAEKPKISPMA
ncbi:MAG: bifunctional demethylmenaquinone methyltransferase/2-methoxy-6-polyprenyl-1,4-benzoquinol methylase UbiE [Sumerlaeia bacterium]